jgi:hypothetical protein
MISDPQLDLLMLLLRKIEKISQLTRTKTMKYREKIKRLGG